MQNTALVQNKKNQRLTFDLKGSTENRYVSVPSKFWRKKSSLNCSRVLKDVNFLEIQQEVSLLKLQEV
jgi:hypothetical protein